jgi:hypothetical protein
MSINRWAAILILAGLAFAALPGFSQAATQLQAPSPVASATGKQLDLMFLSDLKKRNPIPQQMLYVRYYDETTKKSILKTVVTDATGAASLTVPGREDGASCVFEVALSEGQLLKARAFRIPPNPQGGQKLMIQMDRKLLAEFRGAAVQLMSFPVDGAAVGSGGDILFSGSSFPLVFK